MDHFYPASKCGKRVKKAQQLHSQFSSKEIYFSEYIVISTWCGFIFFLLLLLQYQVKNIHRKHFVVALKLFLNIFISLMSSPFLGSHYLEVNMPEWIIQSIGFPFYSLQSCFAFFLEVYRYLNSLEFLSTDIMLLILYSF